MKQFLWKHFKILNRIFGHFKWFQIIWLKEIEKIYWNNVIKQTTDDLYKTQKTLSDYYVADAIKRQGVL